MRSVVLLVEKHLTQIFEIWIQKTEIKVLETIATIANLVMVEGRSLGTLRTRTASLFQLECGE
jgi:hypothetical protein